MRLERLPIDLLGSNSGPVTLPGSMPLSNLACRACASFWYSEVTSINSGQNLKIIDRSTGSLSQKSFKSAHSGGTFHSLRCVHRVHSSISPKETFGTYVKASGFGCSTE